MEHSFQVDDIVKYSKKNRHKGKICFIGCDTCDECKTKNYGNCKNTTKNKIYVAWPDHTKLIRYNFDDLKLESEMEPDPSIIITYADKNPILINMKIKDLLELPSDIPLIDEEIEIQKEELEEEPEEENKVRIASDNTPPVSWQELSRCLQKMGTPV